MSENVSDSTRAVVEVYGRRAAAGLAIATLAGLVILILLGFASARQGKLEQFDESTAVQDRVYLSRDKAIRAQNEMVATLAGEPLFPVEIRRVPDSRLRRAGRDESVGVALYTLRPALTLKQKDRAEPPKGSYFIKLGPGEYLLARAKAPSN